MRRIVARAPRLHVDVGSQTTFNCLLAAVVPVVFVDYRPLMSRISGLECIGADNLSLPFGDGSLLSLSCLHVIEHIGLGRYGDALDPAGSAKAAGELARVLSPGGDLYLGTPFGAPRLCFNAHRIMAAEAVRGLFPGLQLVEFSGVHDDGTYVEHAKMSDFRRSGYACGFYWLRKPA
jgi:hypothetical protein